MENTLLGWPTDWEGESLADLGAEGKMECRILLIDGYTPGHLKNYAEIVERWGELWPAARKVMLMMLLDHDRDPKIKIPGNCLHITIPSEPISEGAEWSIALQKAEDDGVWDATFEGWEVSVEESQPYF